MNAVTDRKISSALPLRPSLRNLVQLAPWSSLRSLLLPLLVTVVAVVAEAGLAADSEPMNETETEFPVPPPPFSDDVFPCSDCHADQETDLRRRELTEFHEEIRLSHGPRERWCFDCHNPDNRDVLRLASGATLPFTESYRLCGQCHGDKYRDWRVGVHGKRSGEWNGRKQYLLCAHCHDPHAPHFAPIKPMPPPVPPALVRQKSQGAAPYEARSSQQPSQPR